MAVLWCMRKARFGCLLTVSVTVRSDGIGGAGTGSPAPEMDDACEQLIEIADAVASLERHPSLRRWE